MKRPIAKSGAEARHLIRQYNRRLPGRVPRYRYTRSAEIIFERAALSEFRAMRRRVETDFIPALRARMDSAEDDARAAARHIAMGIAKMHDAWAKAAKAADKSNRDQVIGHVERVSGVRMELPEKWKPSILRGWANENAKRVSKVSAGFRKKLVASVVDGVREGKGLPEIVASIRARFVSGEEAEKSERALVNIARDQTAKLQGRLTKERHLELGLKVYKWKTTQDERVRESHAERHDERFTYESAIEPQLRENGMKVDDLDGHPSEPPNCRCYAEPDLSHLLKLPEKDRSKELPKEKPKRKPRPKPSVIREADRLIGTVPKSEITGVALSFEPLKLSAEDLNEEGRPKGKAKELLDSMALFTGGNVATVRDPRKYDRDLAQGQIGGALYAAGTGDFANRQYHRVENPTKRQYEIASRVLSEIAQAPTVGEQQEQYRGMVLEAETHAELQPGTEFDLRNISSWTPEESVAKAFAEQHEAVVDPDKPRAPGGPVVMRLAQPKRGRDITPLSSFRGEAEFITGGKVRVTKRSVENGIVYIDVEQE